MSDWEIRKNGKPYAGGPKETAPNAQQRKSMAAAGYFVYVDGKRYPVKSQARGAK